MQTLVIKKTPFLLEVTLKESGVEFEKAKQQIFEKIRSEGRIKGFKKGSHIPEEVILREVSAAAIEQQAFDALLTKLYPKILKKEAIIPTGQAQIKELKSTNPLECILEIEIIPDIEIDEKKLDTIKVAQTPIKVSKKEIDDEVAALKQKFTTFIETDLSKEKDLHIETGDRLTISAQGYEKKGGDALAETAVQSYPLVIGSGAFIPGFEEKLLGKSLSAPIDFDITFPADYHAKEFQSRKVYFSVTVEKIEKPNVPEFDEDFIQKLRGVKTDMEGLRKILKKEIELKKKYAARKSDEEVLMNKFLEFITFDVGPSLLNQEIENMFTRHVAHLQEQGLQIKHYLEHLKISEEGFKEKNIKPEAERRIKAELILRKIRDMKKIEASNEEIQKEIALIISEYQNPEVVARLKEKLVPGDSSYEEIKNLVTLRKVIDLFWKE